MTKKKCRTGALILVGILVIFGALGIALGSHYISYYEIQPNPLHDLKAKDVETIVISDRDGIYELLEEDKAELLRLYDEMKINWLGYNEAKLASDLPQIQSKCIIIAVLKDGRAYNFWPRCYEKDGINFYAFDVNVKQYEECVRTYECDRAGMLAFEKYLDGKTYQKKHWIR